MGFWSDLLSRTRLVIRVSSPTGSVGQNIIISGKLTRAITMGGISGQTVTVTITPPTGSAATVTKTTDSSGAFTLSLPLTMVGTYNIKADYAGVPNQYKPASAVAQIVAKPAAVPVTLVLTFAQEGTVGDTITGTGTLSS